MKSIVKKLVRNGLICALALGCALPVSACNKSNSSDSTDKKCVEKLSDPTFQEGLAVSGLISTNVSRTWWKYQGKATQTVMPYWELGQYCDLSTTRFRKENGVDAWRYDSTKNDLTLATLFDDGYGIEKTEDNYEVLTNQSGSKYVAVDRSTGEINLNVDTSKEYVNEQGALKPRDQGEDWVHLILQQSAGGLVIADYSEIWVELDFNLTKADIINSAGGASQFQWILNVKDKDSVIGDYFWFNLTFFDDRYPTFGGTQMYDGGKADSTGKFIYAPSSDKLYDGAIQVGKDYSVKLNVRPLLEEAFTIAQSKGALAESQFTSMVLNSLNIGWEVTCVADVGVKISHISLNVKE